MLVVLAGLNATAAAQWKNPEDRPGATPATPEVQPPEPAAGPMLMGPEQAPEPRNLRPKFTKGWSGLYWFGMDSTDSKRDPKRPNESGSTRFQQQLLMNLTCTTADQIETTFEVRIDEIKLDLRGQGADAYFDSTLVANPVYSEETNKKINEETPIKSALKPLIGTSFAVTVDSKGNVIRVSGGQTLQAVQANPLTAEMWSVQTVRGLLEPVLSTAHVPERPVGMGNYWKKNEVLGLQFGKLTVDDEYRVTALGDASSTISMEGKVVPQNSDSAVRVVGSKRQGLFEVETSTGMLKNFEYQDDLRMSGKAIDDGRELTSFTGRRIKVTKREPTK